MKSKDIVQIVILPLLMTIFFISCEKDESYDNSIGELLDDSTNVNDHINGNIDYFPLKIGNKWIYSRDKKVFDYWYYDYDRFFSRYSMEIESDSIINDTLFYKLRSENEIYKIEYQRIDMENGTTTIRSVDTSIKSSGLRLVYMDTSAVLYMRKDSLVIIDDLSANVDEISYSNNLLGVYGRVKVTSIGESSFQNITSIKKTYSDLNSNFSYAYMKDIGLISMNYWSGRTTIKYSLTGCIISGKNIGAISK